MASRGKETSRRAVRGGSEVVRAYHLFLEAARNVHQPAGGDVLAEAGEEVRRRGVRVVHGVEEPHREGELERVRSSSIASMAARQRSVARVSQWCPATARSWTATRWAMAVTTAVICSEETVGFGLCPERCAPCTVGDHTFRRRPDASHSTVH
jgi:hypothetical protein